MYKKILILALSITLLNQGRMIAQIPADLQQKLQDTLVYMKNLYNFQGLSASVGYKNQGIWKSAVGQSAHNIPLTTDDLIGIGSNTKTFISAIILKLMENGQINLSDTIGNWIQGYNHINGQITVKQILNHTSGIYSYTNNNDMWDSVDLDYNRLWTKHEILSKFVKAPSFSPGTSWEYCNTNYIIASVIAESILNKPIHQIVRDSILTPLGLNHTFFPPYETANFPYAQVYVATGMFYDFWNFPLNLNSIADGAGAIASNAEDNTKFWQALFNGQIIKQSTLKDSMLNWIYLSSAYSYGLGIFKEKYLGNTVFGHGGTWIGQINSNLVDTSRNIFITVLSNQDSLDNEYTDKVVAKLYQVLINYYPTSVSNLDASPAISIYPNPATTTLTIKSQLNIQKANLYIMDAIGKKVIEKNNCSVSEEVTIQNLSKGIYYLVIESDQNRYTSSFLKE